MPNINPFKPIVNVAMLLTQSPTDRRATALGRRINAVRDAAMNPLRTISHFVSSLK